MLLLENLRLYLQLMSYFNWTALVCTFWRPLIVTQFKVDSVVVHLLRCGCPCNCPRGRGARGHPTWNSFWKSSANGRVAGLFPKNPKHRKGEPSSILIPFKDQSKASDPNRSGPWVGKIPLEEEMTTHSSILD